MARASSPPRRPASGDTDTVAAIAGGLLGARWGASAAPLARQRILHGWPGLRGRDLIVLALGSAQNGQSGPDGWPRGRVFDYSAYGDTSVLAIHPHDRPSEALSRSGRLRTELILAVGVLLEVILVFGLGFPEGAGLADLGHDLAGPHA